MIVIMSTVSLCRLQMTYSNYFKKTTVCLKLSVIGEAPTGVITFISKAWEGRVSDKVITHARMRFLIPLNWVTSVWQTKDFVLVMR